LFSLAFALLVLPFARTFCSQKQSYGGTEEKVKTKGKKSIFCFYFFPSFARSFARKSKRGVGLPPFDFCFKNKNKR
jgi:hypothetical protein